MYPMFLLVLLGGLRRGEVAGLRHDQIDWPDHLITVTHQIACHNHMQVHKRVKTRQGDRLLTLDPASFADLHDYEVQRERWSQEPTRRWPALLRMPSPALGGGYSEVLVDLFFRRPDGRSWHPSTLSHRWDHDAHHAGLPPAGIHSGRHGAATYANAAGASLLAIKSKLGHASVAFTGDVYTSLLHELDHDLAERTAAIIPRKHRRTRSS